VRFDRRWLIATALLAAAVYAAAWIGWKTTWSWVVSVDDAALRVTYSYGVEHPAWVTAWNVLCSVFSPVTFRVVALGVIVLAALRRQWRLVIYLAVAIEVPGLLTNVFKALSDRARPDTALVSAAGSSFPSGHAFGTTVAVLALLAVALPLVRPGRRGPLVVLGLVIALAVGIGRVVLNVHHPSDVVAGWALGYVWFVATLPLLPAGYAALREVAGTPADRGS
jgi:membrane-associated phospholipid phosphatase